MNLQMLRIRASFFTCIFTWLSLTSLNSHGAEEFHPTAEQISQLTTGLDELNQTIEKLRRAGTPESRIADAAIYAKAVDWILRHDEFYSADYVQQARKAIDTGKRRAESLAENDSPWMESTGTVIRGYVSRIDGSFQPYAVSKPANAHDGPLALHVVLHGRAGKMNEVNFIHQHDNKPSDKNQMWIQLDVFGRTNNAYRFAGEVDVFEAIESVQRMPSLHLDADRIVLRGFSMGGAGSWHLGMHHAHRWCSVGPGAGFVDFYKYQKQTEQLPVHQHQTLGIYDAIDYAMNAFNVPVCTYGGEKDSQLVASTSMVEAAKKNDIHIKLLVGPNMGHKFDPQSRQEFLDFHVQQSHVGRRHGLARKRIRFVTRTLKYNQCDWVTIEQMPQVYTEALVEAEIKSHHTDVRTENVSALRLDADIHGHVIVNGADFQIPKSRQDSLFLLNSEQWQLASEPERHEFERNAHLHKRHNLQGPIDDAFTEPFFCVRGTGTPNSPQHEAWANWNLNRFQAEFDKYLRGQVSVVNDTEVTPEMIEHKNLILFGDPGSNSILAKVVSQLPIEWNSNEMVVGGSTFSTDKFGLSMIFPNPLNPKRYVVLNSGHTFHQKDFVASNAWLFPRLGDIAVQKFKQEGTGSFVEKTVYARVFDANWK